MQYTTLVMFTIENNLELRASIKKFAKGPRFFAKSSDKGVPNK